MSVEDASSHLRWWLAAVRPHTLPAAAAPVIVGTGLAVHDKVFVPGPAVAALVGAALIQIGTNLANDYYDAKRGADPPDAEGYTRVTSAGLIDPPAVRRAMLGTFGLAFLVGVYLVLVGGLPIVVIGLSSIAAGILYTGGPYPFGYYGLGDLFVFVFFGLVAVVGTYYVQAVWVVTGIPVSIPSGTMPLEAVIAALPMAALITDILVVNNIRDLETDRAVGKRTLAVILGYTGSRVEFVGLLALAYAVPLWFLAQPGFSLVVLLPMASLPLAAMVARTVLTRTDGEALNPALERVGQLSVLYAGLFASGLAL